MKKSAPSPEDLDELRRRAEKRGVPEIQRHVFLCCDPSKPKCCSRKSSLAAWKFLRKRLKELGLSTAGGAGGVYATRANCLDICTNGPIAVVYPEGTWYCHCDPPVLERIVKEHLLAGKIVREYLILERPLGEKTS